MFGETCAATGRWRLLRSTPTSYLWCEVQPNLTQSSHFHLSLWDVVQEDDEVDEEQDKLVRSSVKKERQPRSSLVSEEAAPDHPIAPLAARLAAEFEQMKQRGLRRKRSTEVAASAWGRKKPNWGLKK